MANGCSLVQGGLGVTLDLEHYLHVIYKMKEYLLIVF